MGKEGQKFKVILDCIGSLKLGLETLPLKKRKGGKMKEEGKGGKKGGRKHQGERESE